MTDNPTRILVVDDSALYRQLISNVLRDIPHVELAGVAKDGREAIDKIERVKPDLLTLDVQMPDMNGIEVLQTINRRKLTAKAIMVSSFTSAGAEVTTEALMQGAFDFILKPSNNASGSNRKALLDALTEKISLFRDYQNGPTRKLKDALPSDATDLAPRPTKVCRAVLIGASTGGPEALKTVLPRMPESVQAPILVVQHMPPRYTASLAKRLDATAKLRVAEAVDGMSAKAGDIIIAAGGLQMGVKADGDQVKVRVSDAPAENGVRPSFDFLLRSAADALNGEALAVVMTGMGRDGLQGCRKLKDAGGYVFAQSQDDCVVYGMPKAVIDDNLADRVLTLGRIAPAITRHIKRSREA